MLASPPRPSATAPLGVLCLALLQLSCDVLPALRTCDPDEPQSCLSNEVCQNGICLQASEVVDPNCRTDRDGDGFGEGCTAGPDCNDEDVRQGNRELCADGADNDCDGAIDEAAMNACGCEVDCNQQRVGAGGTGSLPFDFDRDPADGVGLNADGHLVLSSTQLNTSFIWIANTRQGTVSKIDTLRRDSDGRYIEVARYGTSPASRFREGGAGNLDAFYDFLVGPDPSRTSVNRFGELFVGNRNEGSVIKISNAGSDCNDNNGDGQVRTSDGADFVLEWGDLPSLSADDCVRWRQELLPGDGHRVRALAAQDEERLDGGFRTFVWVGDTAHVVDAAHPGAIWKLDGASGEILLTTAIAECQPYGFALDGQDMLWVSCRPVDGSGHAPALGRLDTRACVDESCLDAPTCVDDNGDAVDDCAGAVKERIPLDKAPYGITVDFKQRVWVGADERLYRYERAAPAGARLHALHDIGVVRGVAADARGFVYAARIDERVAQVVADGVDEVDERDPGVWTELPGTPGNRSWGVAVDRQGKVWVLGYDEDVALVLLPTDILGTVYVEYPAVTGLAGMYTYSDMTGTQLSLATAQGGYYRHRFTGCSGGSTQWLSLFWDADVPAGTRIDFFMRTAATAGELAALDTGTGWVRVASAPPGQSTVAVAEALALTAAPTGAALELELRLVSQSSNASQVLTPVVRAFDVSHRCSGVI
ncbi:MAG: hypothetical protein ACPGUV_02875 [Polyangiales bacterium]